MPWGADRPARELLDGLPDGVFVVDRRSCIHYANARAGEMFLRTPSSLVGESIHTLVPLRSREVHAGRVESAFAHPVERSMSMRANLMALRADGTEFPVDVALRPMGDPEHPFYLATVRDTHEVRRLRAELAFQSRMSQLGLLAAAVAHEVNNPLSLVLGNLELATEELAPDDPLLEHLTEARDGALLVREVVRDFLELGRPAQARSDETVDLGDTVRTALRLCGSQLRRHGDLTVDAPPVRVRGNRASLVQVVLNFVTNAIEATTDGPRRPHVEVGCGVVGDHGALWVKDNGRGFGPEVQERLFTPFFTTRVPAGNGLGLYVCATIVHELGGRVEVRGAPGEGAEFRVVLPRAGP